MNKLEKYIIVTVITAVVFFLIWYFSNIVLYIIFSFVLSLLGKPIMDLISKIKIQGHYVPRWAGATVVLTLFCLLFFIVLDIFIPLIYNKVSFYTSEHINELRDAIQQPLTKLNQFASDYLGGSAGLNSEDVISEVTKRMNQRSEERRVGKEC